jgi:hypothetical protein
MSGKAPNWHGCSPTRLARARTIEQIDSPMSKRHRFAGISIDFENIAAKAQADFQRFMAELYAVMHPQKTAGVGQCAGQRRRFRLPQPGAQRRLS